MARMDPAAKKKLHADVVRLQEKELDLEKELNKLIEDGVKEGSKKYKLAEEALELATEELEAQQKILSTVNKIAGFEKSHAKAMTTATAETRKLVDIEVENLAYRELEKNESLEYNAQVEALVAKRQKLISLSGEDAMLAFDYKETMEEIDLLLEDKDSLSTGQIDFLEQQREATDRIAQGLEAQAGTYVVMHDSQEGLLGALGTSKSAMKGLAKGARQFLAAMIANPATAIAAALIAIVTAIISAVKYAGELRDELGVSMKQAGGLMLRLGPSALALKAMGLDAKEVGGALLTSFGTLDSLTNTTILKAGLINYEFGATHETIAGLAKILHDQVGGTLSQNLDMVSDFGDQFEAAGIAAGAAMDDLASNAEFLADYLDGSAQSMVDATIGARKLGLELGTVAKIADALLEFETSIASTMQASLLIGKQLNFDRARGLALEGKTNEAVQDIVSQLGGVAEFQQLNVIQRRGLAEALGVGTDELAALVRGEPIELDQDSELVTSNKSLIEAINNNTRTQKGGEDLLKASATRKQSIAEQKKTNDLLYLMAKDGKKGADASYKLNQKVT